MAAVSRKIFLSYRREDTKYVAARLLDRFGRGNVFMDVVAGLRAAHVRGAGRDHAAATRQPVPANADPEKIRQTMIDGVHAFIRAYAIR